MELRWYFPYNKVMFEGFLVKLLIVANSIVIDIMLTYVNQRFMLCLDVVDRKGRGSTSNSFGLPESVMNFRQTLFLGGEWKEKFHI